MNPQDIGLRMCWSSAFRLFQGANMPKHELQHDALANPGTSDVRKTVPALSLISTVNPANLRLNFPTETD
jgi:hypothetical protein